MIYLVTGLNHKTAPVALREKMALDRERSRRLLDQVRHSGVVAEAAVLSTCNRVEIYSATSSPEEASDEILRALVRADDSPGGADHLELAPHLYCLSGAEAVSHLFCVTASLDSQVLGENQITGQVKDAFEQALAQRATGAYLNRLFNRALYVAKRVRTETDIGRGNVSIGSASVVMARRIFGDLTGRSVVMLGAGEIAELSLRYLSDPGGARVTILNRTLERAQELARQGLGEARPLSEFSQALAECDILITSISESLESQGYGVRAFQEWMAARGHAPLFIIDLGVPRNVAAAVGDMDNVYLYNIDDLHAVSSAGESARQLEAGTAKNLIDEEVRLFYENQGAGLAGPTIASLGRKFEALRRAELDKTLARLPGLGQEERAAVERLTQSLVSKILHDPILSLKSGQAREESGFLEIFRRLFRLDEDE